MNLVWSIVCVETYYVKVAVIDFISAIFVKYVLEKNYKLSNFSHCTICTLLILTFSGMVVS